MEVQYLIQPEIQLGSLILKTLKTEPLPISTIWITAFVNRQTLLRFRKRIKELHASGAMVRVIVGIDMGGTSKEALEEILSWNVDSRIFNNRRKGHTFHPKIFLFEWSDKALIIVGSNNLTDGGFFKNYEGGIQVTYSLPGDKDVFKSALGALDRFIDPKGATALKLSSELIKLLHERGDIPNEDEARRERRASSKIRDRSDSKDSPFGTEDIASPPPFESDVLVDLVKVVKKERSAKATQKKSKAFVHLDSSVEIVPTSFFMTLPKMRGTIPGEPRIPFPARDMAETFWGWPDNYKKTSGTRGGNRHYLNWKPKWRLFDCDNPSDVYLEDVRMYEYSESSDFRFYSSRLLALGADIGDIVRITRIDDDEATFECVLAKKTSKVFPVWLSHCTESVTNSIRRWGFA